MIFSWHLIKISAVAALFFLAGCASTPEPVVVRMDLHARSAVNPDANGRASPVVVKVYELKSTAAFDAVDFFSVFEDGQKALGAELLNQEAFQLRPGERLELDRPLHLDTRHVAAVAAFRDLEHAQWRDSLAIPPKQAISRIIIQLDGNRILIGGEGECAFFCLQKPQPLGRLEEIRKP